MLKKCTKCEQEKEITEFHKNKNHKDGHQYICKKCKKEYDAKKHPPKSGKCLECGSFTVKKNVVCSKCKKKKTTKKKCVCGKMYSVTKNNYNECLKCRKENTHRLRVLQESEGLIRGKIYMATCSVTNWSYIGKTVEALESRKASHYRDTKYKCKVKFHRALNKYPEDKWEWKILEDNISLDVLDLQEYKWIKTYNTYKKGYNMTGGNRNADRRQYADRDRLFCLNCGQPFISKKSDHRKYCCHACATADSVERNSFENNPAAKEWLVFNPNTYSLKNYLSLTTLIIPESFSKIICGNVRSYHVNLTNGRPYFGYRAIHKEKFDKLGKEGQGRWISESIEYAILNYDKRFKIIEIPPYVFRITDFMNTFKYSFWNGLRQCPRLKIKWFGMNCWIPSIYKNKKNISKFDIPLLQDSDKKKISKRFIETYNTFFYDNKYPIDFCVFRK